ncbi:small acid-soluble spore protein SspI [Paenibacillus sacheonensis]|uniref:Small, acid-soluble spore protein I n=1 Tax=Paenibacillus sacheonensis TaxID=742054 RepID=A0A7X4YUU7_9BACL|nr:small acid-soluble spore protein SspI [Paenibacillus sacheonensis]MBM7569134.1 small acid-soluble spore protein I (minor) [Paenibacillus sacheonensis]NBC72968.1 small, acid-soluble spore protein I [Paenibacillus sacheonensis]
MNNLDLRQAIVRRVQDKSGAELTDVIESSIGSDEMALPGLGVLFEMIWQDSPGPERNRMVELLYNHLHHAEQTAPSPS